MRKRKKNMEQILQITKVKNFFESGFFLEIWKKNPANKSPVQYAFKTVKGIVGAAWEITPKNFKTKLKLYWVLTKFLLHAKQTNK